MHRWNGKECSHYLQYKKKNGNAAIPKGISLLRQKCQEVRGRASPSCSPHTSDTEMSDSEEVDLSALNANDKGE
jgi:hypothetical protein